MNKETVYKDLLSYKIPEDDLKIIAEVFIYLQNHDINLLLTDLIKIYLNKSKIISLPSVLLITSLQPAIFFSFLRR